MIKAAIDIGTVTTRLLIGNVENGRMDTLGYSSCITNLGEGLTSSGIISDSAYLRVEKALLEFREIIAQFSSLNKGEKTLPVKAVATSAMRDAANAQEVLAMLSEKGFNVEIISGKREAELSFKGTLSGFDDLEKVVMSLDVGGGSTEVILGTSDANILYSHSFDIGSRRVTEMFLKSDPPTSSELNDANRWIEKQTREALAALPMEPLEILAVAGTATSALTMRDKIVEYDSSLVHGKRLYLTELQEIISTLSALKLAERIHFPGLEPGRAPVIIGGLITLETLLKILNKDSFIVSNTDILHGILLCHSSI